MKAFLSHTHFDKDFVAAVFQELTSAKAVFDAANFEKNADLVTEIRAGLYGCDLYILFLSKASLKSGWVRNEIDISAEMKAKGLPIKFLVFQLDETHWSELPDWLRRYVVSCPPSPLHVAARIKDEFHKNVFDEEGCYGRSDVVKNITSQILDRETAPSFLFLTGPTGIGRKTVAREIYRTLYRGVANQFIEVQYEEYFDVVSLYRKLLNYSANWQARAFAEESARFSALHENGRLVELVRLIQTITVEYNQVLIIDLGAYALDVTEKLSEWLTSLMDVLPGSHYPYIVFISNRAVDGFGYENGQFHSIDPLDEKDSEYLFKVLINKYKIDLPSREEKENIQRSVIGHPGLIATVVNYLRTNPRYKPNRTHNNVVALVRAEVEKMLRDFLSLDHQLRPVVALFGEAHVISYNELLEIDKVWPNFSATAERLIDAGFLHGVDGFYQLSSYLRRYAQNLAENGGQLIAEARKVLFSSTGDIDENTFIPVNLLDSRIVEHLVTGTPIPGYLSNLVMPIQQLKAARRRYDKQDYKRSLSLAIEAYEQSAKLSSDGVLEAWRLIGLSAVRERNEEMFDFFLEEYSKISPSQKRDGLYSFAQGFKSRSDGDLRGALKFFKKVEKSGFSDAHVHREIAYIYSFDGQYEDAIKQSKKALRLSPLSPYVLDVQVWALLRSYRETRNLALPEEIDACLDRLRESDLRENTNFFLIREKMREITVEQSDGALSAAFDGRKDLAIHVKISLLEILSEKGRNSGYDTLSEEISRFLKTAKNPLADIEFARVQIVHLSFIGKKDDAMTLLNRFRKKFTEHSEEKLLKLINSNRR